MNALGAAIVILSAWRWAKIAISGVQSVSETSRASFDVAHSEDNIAFSSANCRRSSPLSKSACPRSTLATGRDNVVVAGDEHSG